MGELRQWHYIYVHSIESRLMMRGRYPLRKVSEYRETSPISKYRDTSPIIGSDFV